MQDKPDEMKTLSQVMETLRKRGYDKEFRMSEKGFVCTDTDQCFKPEDLMIVRTYRFEGDSNPSDMSILYAMQSRDNELKGICLDAFGTYTNANGPELADFIRKVAIIDQDL